jgi:hypothetical protein
LYNLEGYSVNLESHSVNLESHFVNLEDHSVNLGAIKKRQFLYFRNCLFAIV